MKDAAEHAFMAINEDVYPQKMPPRWRTVTVPEELPAPKVAAKFEDPLKARVALPVSVWAVLSKRPPTPPPPKEPPPKPTVGVGISRAGQEPPQKAVKTAASTCRDPNMRHSDSANANSAMFLDSLKIEQPIGKIKTAVKLGTGFRTSKWPFIRTNMITDEYRKFVCKSYLWPFQMHFAAIPQNLEIAYLNNRSLQNVGTRFDKDDPNSSDDEIERPIYVLLDGSYNNDIRGAHTVYYRGDLHNGVWYVALHDIRAPPAHHVIMRNASKDADVTTL